MIAQLQKLHVFFFISSMSLNSAKFENSTKEIKMILRLFLVIAMSCKGSSSQTKSITQPLLLQAGWEGVHAVGSNSLETTYILFELPKTPLHLSEQLSAVSGSGSFALMIREAKWKLFG